MRSASVLPYAIVQGQVYLLLGKEKKEKGWSGSEKWSDFGGSIEKGRTVFQTAIQEFWEETMGLIMSRDELKEELQEHFTVGRDHVTYLLPLEYDPQLVWLFHNAYQYQRPKVRRSREGCFEKTEIKWFSLDQIKQIRNKKGKRAKYRFRSCFLHTLDTLSSRGI